jgi:hypothetical protein
MVALAVLHPALKRIADRSVIMKLWLGDLWFSGHSLKSREQLRSFIEWNDNLTLLTLDVQSLLCNPVSGEYVLSHELSPFC